MKKLARSKLLVTVLVAVCALLAVVTLRATAQQLMTGPKRSLAQQESAPDAPANPPAAPTTPPPQSTPATPPAPAPKPPAGSGGIRLDDATVAPDKGQSADNNVSFPTDI